MATHEEIREEKKKEIFKAVKKLGRVPISRITGFLGMNYSYVIKYIDELVAEKKLIKEVETNATYVRENVKVVKNKSK